MYSIGWGGMEERERIALFHSFFFFFRSFAALLFRLESFKDFPFFFFFAEKDLEVSCLIYLILGSFKVSLFFPPNDYYQQLQSRLKVWKEKHIF